jgi:beta-lysine 5,6-aminomutase alpha subunit
LVVTGLTPTELATNIADGNIQLQDYLTAPLTAEVVALGQQLAAAGLQRISDQRAVRTERLQTLGSGPQPLLYVIVASGNIYEDVVQARVAVRQGADIIAVIRSTGQSLLDYVPEGPTTEGYGGTYATEANFALMRAALDDIGAEVGRYIRLCNYASGLCMPEIAVLGGLQRLDMMLNDALYGILFRDINMQRTLCDQQLSRKLSALAGIVINTGEDNYLTTADAVDAAHTVVASTLINEALARSAGLQTWQLGLGHAMEIDPERPGAIVLEIAQATLLRQLFPGAPLKYMPPTKHMTGNVMRGHVQDTLFNVVGVLTGQGIQLLGMPTEAMHTPHIHDRAWALEAARLAFDGARALGGELQIRPGGQIAQRAAQTLVQARDLLADMAKVGLFVGLSRGLFADIARSPTGGRGLDGVARRAVDYWDPSEALLDAQLAALPAEPPPAVPARGPAPRHGGQP